eukprot:5629811-Prorocentrum_lima.AAC.1
MPLAACSQAALWWRSSWASLRRSSWTGTLAFPAAGALRCGAGTSDAGFPLQVGRHWRVLAGLA